MAVSRVDTHSKRPSPSSQPAATLRFALCAAQNRRTARTLEPPPTDNRIGNPCSQACYRFWRPKVFSNGAFFFVVHAVFAGTCRNSLSVVGTPGTCVRASGTG
jgi:hypothetical protein